MKGYTLSQELHIAKLVKEARAEGYAQAIEDAANVAEAARDWVETFPVADAVGQAIAAQIRTLKVEKK